MEKPRFSTLCRQAEIALEQQVNDINIRIADLHAKIAILQDRGNMAREFFASGMSFRMNEDNLCFVDVRDVMRDKTGEALLYFFEDDLSIKPSNEKNKMLEVLRANPTLVHEFFCDGYDYECMILNGDVDPNAQYDRVHFHLHKSTFWVNPAKYLKELEDKNNHKVKALHVSDNASSSSSLIKSGCKYAIVVNTGLPDDPIQKSYADSNPFQFDDVFIGCESFGGSDDYGFLLLKKNAKWGVMDVSTGFELQIVVDFLYDTPRSAAHKLEQVMGRKLRVEWQRMDEYDPNSASELRKGEEDGLPR